MLLWSPNSFSSVAWLFSVCLRSSCSQRTAKLLRLLHKQCTSLAVPGESLLRAAFLNNLMSFISQSLLEHKAEATNLQEGQASG